MSEAGFPREARLLTPDAFTRALKTRPIRGKFLWVYRVDTASRIDPLSSLPTSRTETPADPAPASPSLANAVARPQLGMMIGKKNARTAVLRNAIKRRLRDAFRVRQCALPAYAYVVRLAASAQLSDAPLIKAEWEHSLDSDIKKNKTLALKKMGAPS